MAYSLNSFLSSNQYTRENISVPFVGAMLAGTAYLAPTFTNDGVTADPGGLFGWLIYSRTTESLGAAGVKGTTADTYILYNNPSDLVQDLNRLGGITSCLLATSPGGTYAFFLDNGSSNLIPTTNGLNFIHAINYMAYGGSLVIAGTVNGFNDYLSSDASNRFDVGIDPNLSADIKNWIVSQPYTIGIFPSRADAGITGLGYTLGDFSSVGSTNGIRFFSVYGLKQPSTDLDTSPLKANSKVTYEIPAVSDVAGFFTRAKNVNELYITVAGLERSTLLNGKVEPTVLWESSLKSVLRTNKVNFFVTNNPSFLGSDLVGVTASTGALTSNDRVGPAALYSEINKLVNQIGLQYIFQINNATTRSQVSSAIETGLDQYASFLDTTKTQIICDNRNNVDNSSTLSIQVIAKPIVSTETYVINFTYTS
jgi:hypothetical protein